MNDHHQAIALVTASADGQAPWADISPVVQSVDVEDHDRLTDKATIVLEDPSEIVAHASFEGLVVRVAMGWQGDTATIFEGLVTAARVITQARGQRVELTALDFSHRLSQTTSDPPEEGQRVSAYLRKIVVDSGHHIAEAQIQPSLDFTVTPERPLRRSNVNDWEFIQHLAERQVCRSFVEFDGRNSSKFFFVPLAVLASATPVGELRYCRGFGELISFDYERISSGATTNRSAGGVDPVTGAASSEHSPPPAPRPPLPAPGTEGNNGLTANQRSAVEALTELTATANARIQPRQELVAGQASDPARAAEVVAPDPTRQLGYQGNGTATGHHAIRAKSMVAITGVAPWAEGGWYMLKVNHVYTRDRVNNRDRSSYFTKFKATR